MSLPGRVERVRPLLGAQVRVSCVGLPREEANRGIDRAFSVIAEMHRLMSFHEPDSDLSRMNRSAARAPVAVAPATFAALRLACQISEASSGVFDVTVGRELSRRRKLPRPPGAPEPDPEGSWRDIECLPDGRIAFRRPLWVDLGGIGKGFAVDRAIETVAAELPGRWIVNAGGDLRVAGDGVELVLLDAMAAPDAAPGLEVGNASVASSSGRDDPASLSTASHLDGRTRRLVGRSAFVSVVAQECAVADALTKVVLARGRRCGDLLRRYGATAFLQDARGGWQVLGASSP